MPNVLILSAGRRVELVQLFQQAVRDHKRGGVVVAADAQGLAPALYFADRRARLPKVSAPTYIPELCALIKSEMIDLVVPTIDPELEILAKHRLAIESETNAWVMIASSEIVGIASDKLLTQRHILRHGLRAPEVYESSANIYEDDYPVIVKPRSGSSSIGVNVARTPEELDFFSANTITPMIQAIADGPEYTVDCMSDLKGRPVTIVPRLRIATRGGEILKGRIARDREVIGATHTLLEATPMPGHSTIQCFKTLQGVEFIEINPRFGGGAPMSIQAGANSCENLLRILDGERLTYNENYTDGAVFLRYDKSVRMADAGEDIVR